MLRIPNWLSNGLVILIAFTWLMSLLGDIFITNYDVPPACNGLFSAVITTLLIDRHEATKSSKRPDRPIAKSRVR
jgi:hypothetical protein